MKVALDASAPGVARVWGVRVAARHAAWVELVVASWVNPRASFVGHAAGILAGLLWTSNRLDRVVRRVLTSSASTQHHRRRDADARGPSSTGAASGRPRYTYHAAASGTRGGLPGETASSSRQWSTPRGRPETESEIRRRRVDRFS
mmetsp:Transcript_16797/g.67782  ORF Transcript_16797/g.67782 Transcript_16797/m.67782 type:complete len:146 (+) Transcript_16797:794-1231(+)